MHRMLQSNMKEITIVVFSLFCCINLFNVAFGEVVYEAPVELDVCQQICSNKALNFNDDSTTQCERGCRFFNIAMNTNWSVGKAIDLNATKDQCGQSCSDAYPWQTDANCVTGCCEMMQLQKDAWLFYLEQQGDSSILDIEVSLVSDPALWEQTFGANTVYKIPQTYLRSMPIQPELTEIIDEKSWTPCNRTNDIPRWVVGLIAAILVVITVYVSYLLPSRPDSSLLIENNEMEPCHGHPESMFYENGELKLSVVFHEDEPCPKKGNEAAGDGKLVTVNEFFTEDFHANVVPPPKYTMYPDLKDEKA